MTFKQITGGEIPLSPFRIQIWLIPMYTQGMEAKTPEFSPEEFIFTFAATGDAINGEKALLAGGIRPGVMPLPERIGAGCGICLRVCPAELERARVILGGAFREIYAAGTSAASGKKDLSPWNP
jgi:ferredoxin